MNMQLPFHKEIPDYPETALREAIVNAVCHRDYFTKEVLWLWRFFLIVVFLVTCLDFAY